MIAPVCHHTMPTKANLAGAAPSPTGWIFSCRDCFEAAVRANLMKERDLAEQVKLQDRLRDCLKTIQDLESDIQDFKMSRRTAFIRCSCGRMKELNLDCRGCGT